MRQLWSPSALLSLLLLTPSALGQTPVEQLKLYRHELDDIRLLLDTGRNLPARDAVIRRADIYDPITGQIERNQRVSIAGGRITAVREDDSTPATDGQIVPAEGWVLMPGLTDMHVHQLTGVRQHLLNVLAGVTTVRDMDGFDWLLRWREQSARDEWMAPSMVVTGHILNGFAMGMYATVVEDPDAARAVVRQQQAAGYDYIKIHNRLDPAVFAAICDEARQLGIGVVGHIPHDIKVATAIAAGMEVLEHFKGYILDSSLKRSREDFLTPTRGSDVWNDPTFYAIRQYFRGDEAKRWFSTPEAAYVPTVLKQQWRNVDDRVLGVQARLNNTKKDILQRLLPVTDRFLAGTDSGGGYPFMVAGFALLEELRLLRWAGLGEADVIRAATINPARAMNRESDFGTVAAGRRADLVFVSKDPQSGLAFDDVQAVMIRGRWIDPAKRNELLAALRAGAAADMPTEPTTQWVQRLVADARSVHSEGFVFPTHQLAELATALRSAGFAQASDQIAALAN